MLGADTIKNIVLSESVVKQFDQVDAGELEHLNRQSKVISLLAQRFAMLSMLDKQSIGHCQLAGMVCTLGDMIVLDRGIDVETSAGFSPQTIAGYTLSLWSLPDAIVEAVIGHRDPVDIDSPCTETPASPQACLRAAWIACEQYVECDQAQREQQLEMLRAVFNQLAGDEALARAWLGEVVECDSQGATQVA